MADDTILFSKENAVARITLNRPDRLNAMTRPLLSALKDSLEDATQDPSIRAILLTGKGRGFCAGQDLEEEALMGGPDIPQEIGVTLDHYIHPVIECMLSLPKPIVVAVNGVAAGAGMSLALSGDIVLAAQPAKFIQAFVKIGLTPDGGSTWLLPRLIGMARAKALMMTGAPLSAQEAADMGLIWKCLEEEALMGEAEKLASALAAAPPQALAGIKTLMEEGSDFTLARQLKRECQSQKGRAASQDFAEGVAAFREKRAPSFTGK